MEAQQPEQAQIQQQARILVEGVIWEERQPALRLPDTAAQDFRAHGRFQNGRRQVKILSIQRMLHRGADLVMLSQPRRRAAMQFRDGRAAQVLALAGLQKFLKKVMVAKPLPPAVQLHQRQAGLYQRRQQLVQEP